MTTAVEAHVAPVRDVSTGEAAGSASPQHETVGDRKKERFFGPTLYIGLIIAVLALLFYAGVGVLGTLTTAYAVLGLALGVTLAVLPGASPLVKLVSFLGGGALAFLSFAARAALLPVTPSVTAAVVFVTVLVIAVIAALTRNPTCLVAMLLGAGAVYGLSEVAFAAAPVASLATTVATVVALPLSFALGFAVPQLFGLTLGNEDSAIAPTVQTSTPADITAACAFCPIRFGEKEDLHGTS